ncbi:hypothetical protein SARC_00111 [Sphaeroforma arctica JP610]|uniref:Uncharacterized protein n=1 Tax=Sphaeroforma arctica JP610 TaxID=667725 RepID=A0A0L0GG57_9EUKA|nr:hypothetical protein SARC_00111 [Sphaeroforma arctica JP610]KNC87854.1 hypothetical protein SARC_00111 [Sphaeroforma arctica JP610]|eukprot:XP_014161756.1 hypothetical protein SARC_00111 [Sphaeroforma arctica JP610]
MTCCGTPSIGHPGHRPGHGRPGPHCPPGQLPSDEDCGNFIVIKAPICPTPCPTSCPTRPPKVNYFLLKSVCTEPPTPPPCPPPPCTSNVTFMDMNGNSIPNANSAQFLFVNNGQPSYSYNKCQRPCDGYAKFLQYR